MVRHGQCRLVLLALRIDKLIQQTRSRMIGRGLSRTSHDHHYSSVCSDLKDSALLNAKALNRNGCDFALKLGITARSKNWLTHLAIHSLRAFLSVSDVGRINVVTQGEMP
jgi:hypothetical protein